MAPPAAGVRAGGSLMRPLLGSLAFQVTAALLGLLLLFALGGLYGLGAFQRQVASDSVVDIAGRLELTAERMYVEAMQYKQNAPRDYPTYYRDVRLYYRNLSADVATFDAVVDAFMRGDLRGEGGWMLPWVHPEAGPDVAAAIRHAETVWAEYREGLFAALGDDPEEPRLEWAAEHAMEHHEALNRATRELTQALRDRAQAEHQRILHGAPIVGGLGVLLASAVLLLMRYKVLRPLRRTIRGFAQVAHGDFSQRLPVTGATEVRELTGSFNRLAARLDVLHRLIERLQQGNDLDELIGFIAAEFRDLLGFDWIGVVSVDAVSGSARIETSRLDEHPERAGMELLLPVSGGLIKQALEEARPQLVADIGATLDAHPDYRFLGYLGRLGMHSAIALPLSPDTQTPVPALVVFATRSPGRYDAEHLRFLGNIAQLVTQSFGRTAHLAERSRLAAVGEFASGVAHEVRTPLSTITLALEYLGGRELDERTRRRVDLATQEARRVERLMSDMLLYAKPLRLDLGIVDLGALAARMIAEEDGQGAHPPVRVERGMGDLAIIADEGRMRQVLANLIHNARAADPCGERIVCRVARDETGVRLCICNGGEPIPAELIPRLTEPFFSTRSAGTGLGLAIVRRLVELHGGRLCIRSEPGLVTEVCATFPPAVDAG